MESLRLPVWLTVCALIIIPVRQQRPEFAMVASMAAGMIAFFLLKDDLMLVTDWLRQMGSAVRAPEGTSATLLKAGGIAIVSEFAADLCSDAGEKSLAGRIEMAERILLTAMCITCATGMLNILSEMLP